MSKEEASFKERLQSLGMYKTFVNNGGEAFANNVNNDGTFAFVDPQQTLSSLENSQESSSRLNLAGNNKFAITRFKKSKNGTVVQMGDRKFIPTLFPYPDANASYESTYHEMEKEEQGR